MKRVSPSSFNKYAEHGEKKNLLLKRAQFSTQKYCTNCISVHSAHLSCDTEGVDTQSWLRVNTEE